MKLKLALAVLGLTVVFAGALGHGSRASADVVATNVTVGSSPRVVAIAPNRRVFVANRLSNSLSVVDSGSDAVVNTISVSRPGALHIGTDGRVYVPDHDRTGSTLTVIDSNSYAATTVSTGGLWPSAVDTSPDDSRVVVTNELSNSVAVFDGSLNLLTNPPLAVGAKPHTVVVNPAGTKAYVARQGDLAADPGGIVVIDLASPQVLTNITVGSQPTSLDFVGSTLFVGNSGSSNVSVIDTTSDTVIRTVPTDGAPHGIAETPDRSRVFVANEAAGTVTALSGSGDVLAASIPVGLRPQRIHVTSDGKRAYVPNEGSDSVSVIDVASLTVVQTLDSAAGIGAAPTSLQTLGSSKVYVADKSSNAVSVVDIEETAPPTATPPSTSTPISSATAAATDTAIAMATLAPGETPPPADTPPGVSASGGTPSGGAGDVSSQDATSTQAASVLGATGVPGSATPASSPTARAQATMMSVGIIAQSTSEAGAAPEIVDASSSGGAPSWMWLAVALGVLGAAGAGGYLGRARIKLYLSRIRR